VKKGKLGKNCWSIEPMKGCTSVFPSIEVSKKSEICTSVAGISQERCDDTSED